MTQKTHILKILHTHYQKIVDGRKTFEIRKDDRGFNEGDFLILHSHYRANYPDDDEVLLTPTEWAIRCRVTHKSTFEQQGGYCVLAIQDVEKLKCIEGVFYAPVTPRLLEPW